MGAVNKLELLETFVSSYSHDIINIENFLMLYTLNKNH